MPQMRVPHIPHPEVLTLGPYVDDDDLVKYIESEWVDTEEEKKSKLHEKKFCKLMKARIKEKQRSYEKRERHAIVRKDKKKVRARRIKLWLNSVVGMALDDYDQPCVFVSRESVASASQAELRAEPFTPVTYLGA